MLTLKPAGTYTGRAGPICYILLLPHYPNPANADKPKLRVKQKNCCKSCFSVADFASSGHECKILLKCFGNYYSPKHSR